MEDRGRETEDGGWRVYEAGPTPPCFGDFIASRFKVHVWAYQIGMRYEV
jgi:hypothetical protein